MQRFPTRRRSNTPLLIATVGIGALTAYALSSPRRRAALAAAGQSALEAGSRLATASSQSIQELIPDSASRIADKARSASDVVTATAAARLQDAVDRASRLMHELVERARRAPVEDLRASPAPLPEVRKDDEATVDSGASDHSSPTRGLVIAAAAVGAGLYAIRRYGAGDGVRQKLGADERGTISLERTLFIDAPIEQVFDAWAHYENFPRFMSSVESVRALEGDRSHWKVRGPARIGVEFDAITRKQRPSELAWESEPGSTVQNDGRVTFVPEGSGTRATVRLWHRPAAGAVGQAVSSLLGPNPKQQFEEDLNRMKQFIEGRRVGSTPSL